VHSKNDLFYWYSTDAGNNNGHPGVDHHPTTSTCTGEDINNNATFCNTETFVARVNTEALCGLTNWALPNIHELQSIVQYGKTESPAIDDGFFPNHFTDAFTLSSAGRYWSSNSWFGAGLVNQDAWYVNFSDGQGTFDDANGVIDHQGKNIPTPARLVNRGSK